MLGVPVALADAVEVGVCVPLPVWVVLGVCVALGDGDGDWVCVCEHETATVAPAPQQGHEPEHEDVERPGDPPYVPAGQSVGERTFAAQYEPAGQAVQFTVAFPLVTTAPEPQLQKAFKGLPKYPAMQVHRQEDVKGSWVYVAPTGALDAARNETGGSGGHQICPPSASTPLTIIAPRVNAHVANTVPRKRPSCCGRESQPRL